MKFAVLGAAGQLAQDLCPRLPGEVIPLTRQQADLTRSETLRKTLGDIRPDVVINCAAYTFVDKAESEPEIAFAINAWGVRDLAMICRALDCILVHFSTDHVFGFDESRRTPYTETDSPGPVSVYGLSKLAGEYLTRSICPKHFVIRTCGLYGVWGSGGKGGNFVETMLRLAAQGKSLRVVADQTCTPSYTVDVATAAVALTETGRYGLYHLTNSGSCTWFEFAKTIFQTNGTKVDLTAIPTNEYPLPARRPAFSVLSSRARHALGLPHVRHWSEAVSAYLQERQKKSTG